MDGNVDQRMRERERQHRRAKLLERTKTALQNTDVLQRKKFDQHLAQRNANYEANEMLSAEMRAYSPSRARVNIFQEYDDSEPFFGGGKPAWNSTSPEKDTSRSKSRAAASLARNLDGLIEQHRRISSGLEVKIEKDSGNSNIKFPHDDDGSTSVSLITASPPQCAITPPSLQSEQLYSPRSAASMMRAPSIEALHYAVNMAQHRHHVQSPPHALAEQQQRLFQSRDIGAFLDLLKTGWAEKFLSAFASIGAQSVDDLYQLNGEELGVLENALKTNGARLVEVRRITESVRVLSQTVDKDHETAAGETAASSRLSLVTKNLPPPPQQEPSDRHDSHSRLFPKHLHDTNDRLQRARPISVLTGDGIEGSHRQDAFAEVEGDIIAAPLSPTREDPEDDDGLNADVQESKESRSKLIVETPHHGRVMEGTKRIAVGASGRSLHVTPGSKTLSRGRLSPQ